MWASLVENSDAKRVLPRGQNWILSKQIFDGITMQLELIGHSTKDKYLVKFDPIYWAISDEWVEAYGNIPSKSAQSSNLKDVKESIEDKWPGQGEPYNAMKAYFISAMQWDIRFISYEEPIVTKQK